MKEDIKYDKRTKLTLLLYTSINFIMTFAITLLLKFYPQSFPLFTFFIHQLFLFFYIKRNDYLKLIINLFQNNFSIKSSFDDDVVVDVFIISNGSDIKFKEKI